MWILFIQKKKILLLYLSWRQIVFVSRVLRSSKVKIFMLLQSFYPHPSPRHPIVHIYFYLFIYLFKFYRRTPVGLPFFRGKRKQMKMCHDRFSVIPVEFLLYFHFISFFILLIFFISIYLSLFFYSISFFIVVIFSFHFFRLFFFSREF